MSDPRMEPTPFPGRIGRTVQESTPAWAPAPRPRDGAPNVVVVVLDDVGFGQLGCYGSSISTPTMDALAEAGIRFSNFHVTSLCSTTRACLLTGRNHHSVGVGFLGDFDTGYPSYRGAVTPRAATVAELLRDAGYGTYAVGKWHLTPPQHMSPAGPFHTWPTQRGFDRYYGFLWGEDDQWSPEIWYDQHRVDPPVTDGYHLSEDLVDRAVEFLSDHVSATPDRPFFLYLAFGACHAPHQAPRPYIDRYRGAFDHGWDEERERVLRRQLELGVVPESAGIPPSNPGVQVWKELSAQERALYARMQEVFAGFMEHTDTQIGRLRAFLDDYGLDDDTIVVLLSDNGASGEGGEHGSANEYRYFLGLDDPLEDSIAAIDELGGPATHNHYPAGWAQAGNTPLKFYKKFTFGGGVRAPLIMRWPGRLAGQGSVRRQFHHVIDIAPTILDLAGVEAPSTYRGVPQLPVHGVSMRYSFAEPAAPSTRSRQYFETAGHRGIVRDGYKAVTHHVPGTPFDDDIWELYHLDQDFSERRDLAAAYPDLLEELKALWWSEAETYEVLPLDDRMQERVLSRDPATERTVYTLLPGAHLPSSVVGPNFTGRPFHATARIERDGVGDDGVLLAYGRRAAGFSWFVQDNHVWLDYNLAGSRVVLESTVDLPVGRSELDLHVEATAAGARARLLVSGAAAGEVDLPSLLPGGLGCLSTQAGHNSPSEVSPRYDAPFRFSGVLRDVTIRLMDEVGSSSKVQWDAAQAID